MTEFAKRLVKSDTSNSQGEPTSLVAQNIGAVSSAAGLLLTDTNAIAGYLKPLVDQYDCFYMPYDEVQQIVEQDSERGTRRAKYTQPFDVVLRIPGPLNASEIELLKNVVVQTHSSGADLLKAPQHWLSALKHQGLNDLQVIIRNSTGEIVATLNKFGSNVAEHNVSPSRRREILGIR